MRARALWGGTLAAVLTGVTGAGCVGNIGDGGGAEPASETQALCADEPFARRLTVAEYVASVRDVLGVDIAAEAATALPADLRADGFSNTAGALIVTLDHVEGYDELAELAVSKLGDVTAFAAEHVSCAEVDRACGQALAQALAPLLLRSPASDDEVAELAAVFDAVSAEGEGFDVAVTLLLRAMLQSPRFLYRIEDERCDEEICAVDGWAMASRLSYLLWGSAPDATLRQAADALTSDEQIEAQVRRMLADPRARETSRRYLSDWLNLGRLDNLQRDATAFPDWDPALARDMKDETLAYWEHIVWEEERSLSTLFTSERAFITPGLAAHYGIDVAPSEDGSYDLSGVPERIGLLTQGSIATIGGNTASMVSRGLFLLENFLCSEIGSPPPGIDTTPPPVEPGASQRTASEGRVENPSCGGCHSRMEPLSWGIERYDATGAYAEIDPLGNDLLQDGSVIFPGRSGGPVPYATTAELAALFGESDEVMSCMAQKSTQFAMGRPLHRGEKADGCTLAAIDERFLASAGTYADLMVAIALSPAFRNIVTPVEDE